MHEWQSKLNLTIQQQGIGTFKYYQGTLQKQWDLKKLKGNVEQ